MRWSWIVLSWLAVAAVAVAAVWAVAFRPAGAPERDGEESTYPLSLTKYTDARQVSVRITAAPDQPLILRTGGVATRLDCQVGGTWRSGETPVSVNSTPVLLLASPAPWYRDLTSGAKGADVTALQRALVALGSKIEVTGEFDSSTLAAWRSRARRAGLPTPDAFQMSSIIWIPKAEVMIKECPARLGQDLSAGTPVAAVGSGQSTLTYQPPTDLLEGERELVVDTATAPLDADLQPTPEGTAAILATQQVAALTRTVSDEPPQFSAVLQLTKPVEVYAVPASAVHRDSQGAVCVISGGSPHAAKVISSSLGLTYVRLDDPPASVDAFPKKDAKCA